MENNDLKVYEFDKNLPQESNIKNFILSQVKIKKALRQMDKVRDLFSEEIGEYEKNLHITKSGEAMFVSDMTDSHLINTVKIVAKSVGYNYKNSKIKKYINEVKKRGLISEIMDINEQEDESVDFIETDDENIFGDN